MGNTANDVLIDIYDAWRAHDPDWLASYLPQEFCHVTNVPVSVTPLGGTRQGKAEAIGRLQQIWSEFETKRLEIGDIALEPGSAAIEVRMRCVHRRTGRPIDVTKTNVWTLEDGWPVKLVEQYDVAHLQAFFSSLPRVATPQ